MRALEKILRSAEPGPAVLFRSAAYGSDGGRAFLCDVLGLANARCDGPRILAIGVDAEQRGAQRFRTPGDAPGLNYAALADEYIEPALRIRERTVRIDGADITVIQIGGCIDPPYMMRADHSASLRRGDAYQRIGSGAVKMGRAQLEKVFAAKFRDAAPARRIEIGFAGDHIVKDWQVATVDTAGMPSEKERTKLRELLSAQDGASGTGSTTVVARLTHARLFGSDQPYEKRSREEILREIATVGDRYWDDDQSFLFARHGQNLELILLNQGSDPLTDVDVAVMLPDIDGLHVARTPPAGAPGSGVYPGVELRGNAVCISARHEAIEPGSPQPLFPRAARFCVSRELAGQRVPVAYRLTAANLPAPVEGRLQLSFANAGVLAPS